MGSGLSDIDIRWNRMEKVTENRTVYVEAEWIQSEAEYDVVQ